MALGSDDDNQDNNSEGVASINNNHDHTSTNQGRPSSGTHAHWLAYVLGSGSLPSLKITAWPLARQVPPAVGTMAKP
jgi:hypothetical protein